MAMKVGVSIALLLASIGFAGCTASEANPHLLAPKLVVHPQDDGNVTLYVHSAFGDQMYSHMALGVDNVTIATRADAFSIETRVLSEGFFVEVTTTTDTELYHLRARIDLDVGEKRVRVVPLSETDIWAEPHVYSLPYERLIERVVPT